MSQRDETSTSGRTIAHLTPFPTSNAYMDPLLINKTQSPGYNIQPQIVDEKIGEAGGGEAGVVIGLGGRRQVRMVFFGFTWISYSSRSEIDGQLLFGPSCPPTSIHNQAKTTGFQSRSKIPCECPIRPLIIPRAAAAVPSTYAGKKNGRTRKGAWVELG